jgi:hypothetical protein
VVSNKGTINKQLHLDGKKPPSQIIQCNRMLKYNITDCYDLLRKEINNPANHIKMVQAYCINDTPLNEPNNYSCNSTVNNIKIL